MPTLRDVVIAHTGTTDGPGDALAQLRAARVLLAELEELELELARDARAGGASWRDLAAAAGLGSRSAAQARYTAASVEDRRASFQRG